MALSGKYIIRTKIDLSGATLDHVNNFVYLRCNISYDYSNDVELNVNISSRICGSIIKTFKNKTRKDTQLIFFKTIVVPTLNYGSQNWVTTKREEQHIKTQGMKFLRRVKGFSRLERLRNEDVRNELNISDLNERIKEQRKNWKEHLDKMGTARLSFKRCNYNSQN